MSRFGASFKPENKNHFPLKLISSSMPIGIKYESGTSAQIKSAVICELIMDHSQEQMPKAINKRLPNGKTIATVFEDMYPFLKKEELLEASYENFIKEKKKWIKL